MAFNKKDLVNLVAEVTDLGKDGKGNVIKTTKKESEAYLDGVVLAIETALARGEEVKLSGFGIFEVRERDARQGRNPKTGESIEIPATKTVGFRPSPVLKKTVRGEAVEA